MSASRDTVNGIRIASPCHMSWDEMAGDDRKRYCTGCRLHVFNISEMDVEEAAQMISDSTDRLCVRLYRRRDGSVLTQDCPVGLRAAIRRRVAAFASSVAMGIGVLTATLLRNGPHPTSAATEAPTEVMGTPALPTVVRRNPFRETLGEVSPMPIAPAPSSTTARMGRIVLRVLPASPSDEHVDPSPTERNR